ncbi:protein jag [Lactobacillus sp. LC28-10]|uniref:RNA-binding protein KhpB n=1 Tax=Secundilactobacillus angelensis TaxID=2722706 RepID=A0ABX1KXQ5_9LACO|nr:RNA-binding cell elongation regulator Jag/EloR [Secundilactobacillus angelensis]MCH5462889.1 protein jag [Secundilactobacillus angelensis]NLR18733.1 protein jag [Secundilactobacillus angelensis]
MTLYTSETVEDAIQQALQQLQLDRSQVEVTVLTKPRKGFLGIGARKASVEVKPAVMNNQEAVARTDEAGDSSVAQTATTDSVSNEQTQLVGETTEGPTVDRQAEYQQVAVELNQYLGEIIKQLGIDATSQVDMKHRHVTINFETEQEGLLIGKHGRTINALQSLAQVYLNHKRFSKLEVTLDVASYRERREETLTRLAENMAREVVATGKPVYLDPMPSFERKQIHSVLAENEHVMTYSAGTEPKRAVVITLK